MNLKLSSVLLGLSVLLFVQAGPLPGANSRERAPSLGASPIDNLRLRSPIVKFLPKLFPPPGTDTMQVRDELRADSAVVRDREIRLMGDEKKRDERQTSEVRVSDRGDPQEARRGIELQSQLLCSKKGPVTSRESKI